MAERPEDLNLPNAVITRIIKEAVGSPGWRVGAGRTSRQRGSGSGVRVPGPGPQRYSPALFSQLPDGVNISKEARSAISRAASVFVLYATSW